MPPAWFVSIHLGVTTEPVHRKAPKLLLNKLNLYSFLMEVIYNKETITSVLSTLKSTF